MPSVASATEGAAPKRPAKLLGLNMSPRMANNETARPPITNRARYSITAPCSRAGVANRALGDGAAARSGLQVCSWMTVLPISKSVDISIVPSGTAPRRVWPLHSDPRVVGQTAGQCGCCRGDTTGKTLRLFINAARCPVPRAKILFFPKWRTYEITKPSRAHWRARRDRHERRARDAMDAVGAQTMRTEAYGQAVWSWHLDAGVKFAGDPQATGANKPDTPGRARSKP